MDMKRSIACTTVDTLQYHRLLQSKQDCASLKSSLEPSYDVSFVAELFSRAFVSNVALKNLCTSTSDTDHS